LVLKTSAQFPNTNVESGAISLHTASLRSLGAYGHNELSPEELPAAPIKISARIDSIENQYGLPGKASKVVDNHYALSGIISKALESNRGPLNSTLRVNAPAFSHAGSQQPSPVTNSLSAAVPPKQAAAFPSKQAAVPPTQAAKSKPLAASQTRGALKMPLTGGVKMSATKIAPKTAAVLQVNV
jgi:hypothetical protein